MSSFNSQNFQRRLRNPCDTLKQWLTLTMGKLKVLINLIRKLLIYTVITWVDSQLSNVSAILRSNHNPSLRREKHASDQKQLGYFEWWSSKTFKVRFEISFSWLPGSYCSCLSLSNLPTKRDLTFLSVTISTSSLRKLFHELEFKTWCFRKSTIQYPWSRLSNQWKVSTLSISSRLIIPSSQCCVSFT